MIRKDGEIFECGEVHPYILYNKNENFEVNIKDLFFNLDWLDWFYEHSNNKWVKDKIISCVKDICDINVSEFPTNIEHKKNRYFIDEFFLKQAIEKFKIKVEPIKDLTEEYLLGVEAEFKDLNDKCNQEFLRCRTGDLYTKGSGSGIYFRISSVYFNWFNIIWKTVYENRNWLSDVTITPDHQSKDDKELFLRHNSTIINKLPVNDFINLSGNPVFESVDLMDITKNILIESGDLLDAFGDFGPYHNHRKFEAWKRVYIQDNFVVKKILHK